MTSSPAPDEAQQAVGSVEAARARLGEVEALPVAAHVGVYDEVHTVLQEALAGLDGG